jgi:hypothetical protein
MNENEKTRRYRRGRGGGGGAVYFLGLIGALVYYIGHADGFWDGVLGVLKSLVWPAFLIYYLLKSVGA